MKISDFRFSIADCKGRNLTSGSGRAAALRQPRPRHSGRNERTTGPWHACPGAPLIRGADIAARCPYLAWRENHVATNCKSRRGFTLIEMLVVIAIIGILAALIVGGLSRAGGARVRSRVMTELKGLETVIGSYHKKHGFYPPSNEKPIGGSINTGTNQLFYELTGMKHDKGTDTFTDIFRDTITSVALDGLLGAKGIVNAGESEQNFLPNLKPSGYTFIPNSAPPFRVLVVPYKGPGGDFNPWHYNSSKPVHNPDSFDLWAEVVVGGKTNKIGNWKE